MGNYAYSENSIQSRAQLSPRTFYCARCTCCVVPALGDLCCFCEDGEICPRQALKKQRERQQAKTDVQVNMLRADLEKQIEELAGALINQGWKSARAKGAAARAVADDPDGSFEVRFRRIMSGDWGEELAPVKKAAPQPIAKEETVPKQIELDVDRYQKLAAKGLTQKDIAAEMGIGYSTLSTKTSQLRREGKLSDAPPEKLAKRGRPKQKTNGHAEPIAPVINGNGVPGHHRHPMLVTPEFLDRFWASLPLEEKVRILERIGSES